MNKNEPANNAPTPGEERIGSIASAVATGTVIRGGQAKSEMITKVEVDDDKVTVVKGSPAPNDRPDEGVNPGEHRE